jgi:hypothetical protein
MTEPSAAKKKNADRKMTVVLVLVVVAAVAIALASARTSHGADAHAETPALSPALAAESAAPDEADSAIAGEVLEAIPVSKYTYLRLRGADGELWAAVPSAVIAIGSQVTIANATRMDDFKSATLGRTFKAIYFGTLGAAASDALAPKYPGNDLPEVNDSDPLPPGHPAIGNSGAVPGGDLGSSALPAGPPSALGASPHGAALSDDNAALPRPSIAKAQGPGAHTIAELSSAPLALAGHRVRVRGQVTKVTPDVQGHTFFHVRDGNLNAAGPVTDLVVTSLSEPKRGQVATFEGTLRANVDIGIGYNYPVLLENATIVAE